MPCKVRSIEAAALHEKYNLVAYLHTSLRKETAVHHTDYNAWKQPHVVQVISKGILQFQETAPCLTVKTLGKILIPSGVKPSEAAAAHSGCDLRKHRTGGNPVKQLIAVLVSNAFTTHWREKITWNS